MLTKCTETGGTYGVFFFGETFMFFIVCVQIEAYRDMIAPVVDAFKYLTQIGLLLSLSLVCACKVSFFTCIMWLLLKK